MKDKIHMCRDIQRIIVNAQNEVSNMIMTTPTSEARNQMTHANIHLAEALRALSMAHEELFKGLSIDDNTEST